MKASEEIRSILDRCKSGELKHDQEQYFCGSSRCIAGWKIHFDYCAAKSVAAPHIKSLERFVANKMEGYEGFNDDEWEYAREAWSLTEDQANRLFAWYRSFDSQYAVVEELEAQGK